MATIALYFVKVMLCSGLLYGYYYATLRNKKFHQYNRFYLLVSVLLSWFIPLVKIDLAELFRKEQNVSYFAYSIASQNTLIEAASKEFQISWEMLFETLFIMVCVSFLIRFIISLLKIRRLLKKHKSQQYKDVVIVLANTAGTPFSFLKFIFWNEDINITSVEGKQILEHELTHIREKHSYDKLFIQVNQVFGWWNIFFWLMNQELSMIHEFIADKKAIHNGDVSALAAMLFKSIYSNQSFDVANPFFFSPIQRRLVMISNYSNPKFSYLRRILILPLFVFIALLFAFRMKENVNNEAKKYDTVSKTIVRINNHHNDIDTSKLTVKIKNATKVDGNHVNDTSIVIDPNLPKVSSKTIGDSILFVLDGKIVGKGKSGNLLKRLSKDAISSVNVLKDETAKKKYGEDGQYGVIEIITKKFAEENKPLEVKDLEKNLNESLNQNTNNKTFTQAGTPAEFPGGETAFQKYLQRNLSYENLKKKHAPPGKYIVTVSFLVDTEGLISNVYAKNDPGYGTKDDAEKLIKKGPKWQPAVQNGQNVTSQREVNIVFDLH